jgi:hypothetical protein
MCVSVCVAACEVEVSCAMKMTHRLTVLLLVFFERIIIRDRRVQESATAHLSLLYYCPCTVLLLLSLYYFLSGGGSESFELNIDGLPEFTRILAALIVTKLS